MSSARPSTKSSPSALSRPRSPVSSSRRGSPGWRRRCSPRRASRCRRRSARRVPCGTGWPSSSRISQPGAVRRAAGRGGGPAQVVRAGDGGPGDLGGAVQVVEDVAVGVHELRCQPARQRRAADRDDLERRARVRRAAPPCSRCTITGTANRASHRCAARAASVAAGSKRRCSTIVARSAKQTWRAANPQVWKIGAAIITRSRTCSGMRSMMDTSGPKPCGVGRRAPLGVPVVPEVSTMIRPSRSGGRSSPGSAPATSSSRARSSSRGSSAGSAEDPLGELVVVHQQPQPLLLGDRARVARRRARC